MLGAPGWTVSTFRAYYEPDQLAYFAIATDWAKGVDRSVEPFTETGSIYYPRLYYQLLGLVARVFGVSPAAAWTVVGLVVQALLVAAIGLTAVLLTRRAWAGLLAFLPFVIGTLANLRGGGDVWYVQLHSHARLWGTFASIFTLNGDNAAMALGAVSLLLLILVAAGRIVGRPAIGLGLAACVVIGGLSAVQTYSFLTASYFLAYAAAVYGLCLTASRWRVLVGSVGLALVLFILGPHIVDRTGPLVLLVLGMAPAVPGILLLWARLGRVVGFVVLGYAIGAAPQILSTLSGVVAGDAFLTFRTGNANDLSVPLVGGAVSALPVLLPLLGVLTAGLMQRKPLWIALPGGGIFAWFLGASNASWGADQEPYRMWLSFFALLSILGLPVVLEVVVAHWQRISTRVLVAMTIALIAVSFPDFLHWRSEVTEGGYLAFDDPRLTAAVEVAAPALDGPGLLAVGPCLDPLTVKAAYTGPVAYFNRGLAWPDRHAEITALNSQLEIGLVSPAALEAAGAGWLLTDTACDLVLVPALNSADLVDSVDYVQDGHAATMQLWRVSSSAS